MENRSAENPNKDIQKLGELIKDIHIAMMATVDPDGNVRSRPMASQQIEFDGDLWFMTGKSTGKIHSLETNQRVNLSYSSPSHSRYVSVFGTAELVDDRAKIKELWNPFYQAWFPKGVEDPEIILLRVRVEGAEYWDHPGGKVSQLWVYAKAFLQGGHYQPAPGEHQKIDLSHSH